MLTLQIATSLLAAASFLPSAVQAHSRTHSQRSRLAKRVDLGVPLSWKNDDTPIKKAGRIEIAEAGAAKMLTYVNDGGPDNVGQMNYWPSANTFSAVALVDYWANNKTNQNAVSSGIKTVFAKNPSFRANAYNDDLMWWGLAAIYAYNAYGDKEFLNEAIANWQEGTKWVITAADASANVFPGKGAIKGVCNGKTMAGGAFWTTNQNNDYVNSITTGLYSHLSAWLALLTKDSKYTDAAKTSVTWLNAHMVNQTDNLLTDGMGSSNCGVAAHQYYTYNQGMYVAAAGILSKVTGDNSWMNDAINIAASAMKTTSYFQGSDGIITEGQGTPHNSNNDGRFFKGIWVRALAILYKFSDGNTDLQTLIHSYVDVQFRALTDKDSDNPGHPTSYGVDWHGPYDAVYPWSQLPALDVLASAILTNNNG